jgi:hypothetical protein
MMYTHLNMQEQHIRLIKFVQIVHWLVYYKYIVKIHGINTKIYSTYSSIFHTCNIFNFLLERKLC